MTNQKNRIYVPGTSAYAYFITIRTYATWFHGDGRGSVDKRHNAIHSPFICASENLEKAMCANSVESPFLLNCESYRHTVLQSVLETCHYNNWHLLAVHVRLEHMHVVLQSKHTKERAAGKIKCYATKALKNSHIELSHRSKFWSYHASTKNVWVPESIFPVLYYVVRRQGEPMSLYYDQEFYDRFDEVLYERYLEYLS